MIDHIRDRKFQRLRRILAKRFLDNIVKSFMSANRIISYRSRDDYCFSCKIPFFEVKFVRWHIYNYHFPEFKEFMISNLPNDVKRNPQLIRYLIRAFLNSIWLHKIKMLKKQKKLFVVKFKANFEWIGKIIKIGKKVFF